MTASLAARLRPRAAALSAAAALVLLASCGGGSSSPSTSAPATTTAASSTGTTTTTVAAGGPSAAEQAEQIFATRCTPCHGTDGRGDGPAAAALNPKPRDYRDAAWQATVTDAEIERTILLGGAAVGKSPLMPPNPDLASKPEVVAALRAKVRSFSSSPVGGASAPADASAPAASAPAASAPAATAP